MVATPNLALHSPVLFYVSVNERVERCGSLTCLMAASYVCPASQVSIAADPEGQANCKVLASLRVETGSQSLKGSSSHWPLATSGVLHPFHPLSLTDSLEAPLQQANAPFLSLFRQI